MLFRTFSCLLSLLLLFLSFIGCSNQKYEYVHSVTITTNGENKTFSSSRSHYFGAPIEITEEEYQKNRSGRDLDVGDDDKIQILTFETINKTNKGATSYSYSEPLMNGFWYYRVTPSYLQTKLRYMKKPYIKTNYSFVYVKVINDTTICIKTSKNETTYTVTSYSIKK